MQMITQNSRIGARPEATEELVRDTLALINSFAYFTSTPSHAQLFSEVTKVELTASALRVLEFLNGRDGTPVSVVSGALGINISGVSRLAGTLELSKYVERASDPYDSRRTLLRISDTMQPVMDKWLSSWTADYLVHVRDWPDADVVELAQWFRLVHESLFKLIPGRLDYSAAVRWRRTGNGRSDLSAAEFEFGESAIALFAWIAQSRWFDTLLSTADMALGQQAYLTLRVVGQRGPLSVADVADRTGVDHTQASKRVKRLVELGLAERGVDSFDRRSSLIRSTRRGREVERTVVDAQYAAVYTSVCAHVSTEQVELWGRLFDRYIHSVTRSGALLDI